MKCLIIGYGSIGKRHTAVLKNLGCEIILVTKQTICDFKCYLTISDAFALEKFDYVVIATPTHLHYSALIELNSVNFDGIVLVEKPLFANDQTILTYPFSKLLIGYNLRFCELLIKAKEIIGSASLISFSAYVGQYLPSWRKGADSHAHYSAKKEEGGGVLRDLSHEIDYAVWFCGNCISLSGLGGQYSSLTIDSEDVFSIMMQCSKCPNVSLHLNYLDRQVRRQIVMNTEDHTITIDLIKGHLYLDGNLVASNPQSVSNSYINQHKSILNNQFDSFCTYEEGLYLMKLITAVERANTFKQWETI